MRPSFVLLLVLAAAACGPQGDPSDRYLRALNAKAQGDAETYFDELVALAHDAPDSRAGRRARAMLQGPDLFTYSMVAGVLSAVAIPNFRRFKERARAMGAKTGLHAVYVAERSFYFENTRYGRSFAEIAFVPEAGDRYVYFLSRQEWVAGSALSDSDGLRRRASQVLSQYGVTPRVTKTGFLAAAVANLDDDSDLEVWTIDESGEALNVLADLDSRF